ncbi:MAG: hypothetical protein ABIG31_01375 [Candidatus Omnitrophota bacterium]
MRKAIFLRKTVLLPLLFLIICCSRQQILAQDSPGQGEQASAKSSAMERQLLEMHLREEEGLRLEAAKITKETQQKQRQLTEQEKKRLRMLVEQTIKEEQAFIFQQKKVSMENKERQKILAAEELKRLQELEARKKQLGREIEEKRRQIVEEEARRLQEIKLKQEELSRQIEERREKIVEREARRLAELKEKEARRARAREENLKRLAEEKAGKQMKLEKLEQEREVREVVLRQKLQAKKEKQLVMEKARRLAGLKEKEEQIAYLREENLKRLAEKKARKQMKLEKLEQEREAREVVLQQKLQAKKEKQLKLKEEARIKEQQRQEEIARRQEEKRQRLAEAQKKREEAQAQKEQEEKARQQRLAEGKEAKEKDVVAIKEQQRQEEIARRQEEKRQRLAEARKKQEEAQAQKEQEEKARQQRLAEEKEAKKKQLVMEKSRHEEELKVRQKQLAAEKARREKQILTDTRKREKELAREKARWERKLAAQKAKFQKELNAQAKNDLQAKQLLTMLEKERRLRERAERKAQREKKLRIKQGQLGQKEVWRQRQQIVEKAKLQQEQIPKQSSLAKASKMPPVTASDLKRSSIQEKALSQANSTKHIDDAKKIKRADELWVRARRLYSIGRYREAIRDFEEIIEIEGNPRIKYTPAAKDYINKANAKLKKREKKEFEKEVLEKDKEMMQEVIERQLPPYVEPPTTTAESKKAAFFETPLIRKQLAEKKISMDFNQVDLKSVITFLSDESGINFIASQKVLEMVLKVTARFEQTPIYEVVKYVTKSLGLLYRIDKDVVWIAHPEEIAQESLESRVYYLNKGGGLFTEFSGSSGGTTEGGLGSSSAQISKIYTIEDTLKEVVPWPQDAKMTFDKRINALIVRNTPQNLQMLEDMLYSLDIAPFQILIEAKFLEVDVTDTKELGLEWKFANEDFAVEQKNGSFAHGLAQNSGVDFSSFSRATEGLNLTYKGVLTTPQFEVILHALDENKKIKTLSSPRITTLNNQLASIKVVDEWIYPTRYDYEIVQFDLNGDGDFNDAGETTYKNVPKDFVRRDVGILLKVIPSIGADKKTISLSLIPEVSEATADYFTYTGDVKLPKFTSRNLSTTVVVNSGDTVVLGGLIKENRTKITTKVPLLADVPFIGSFFKKDTDSITRKNLIIFVTAKLLTPAGEEVIVANAQ